MAKKSTDVTVNPIVDEKLVAKTDRAQTDTKGKGSAKPTPDKVEVDSSVLKSRH